jgi:HAD superfamily hydrolase (TIGR01549 family)
VTASPLHGARFSKYEAVLFDVGYTLVYFEPPQAEIVRQTLLSLGAHRTVEQIKNAEHAVWEAFDQDAATRTFPATREYDDKTEAKLASRLLSQLGLANGAEAVRGYTQAIESWFSRPGVIRPYAEVVEVLETLKARGLRLAIVSNWSWNLRERVNMAGLTRHFEVIWASAYAGCAKPHPMIFHQALEIMRPRVKPERALYVGDSYEHDVVGAQNAGLDVVLLDRKGSAGEIDCPTVGDLWELVRVLDTQSLAL